jgi:hypothetical protein
MADGLGDRAEGGCVVIAYPDFGEGKVLVGAGASMRPFLTSRSANWRAACWSPASAR